MTTRIVSTPVWHKVVLSLAVLLMAVFATTSVHAQQNAGGTDSWQFGASIYGWFPDISGRTSFSQPGGDNDFTIDIEDILDNLEFTLQGSIDVRKGRAGIFTDVIYMDVGAEQSGTRNANLGGTELPVNASADVKLDMVSWIWTLAGYSRALDKSGLTLDVLAGTRYLDIEQEVKWHITGNVGSIPVPDRTGNVTADLSNWDAIIGARGRFAFGAEKAWFLPYYLDVGVGDSDFTWQGAAGFGYAFGWVEAAAVWRYLYYDFPSGRAIEDIDFNGPAIGVTFRW